MPNLDLILASSSSYRAQLLSRLGLPFRQVSPGSDEAPLPGEAPNALAERLARCKAQAVAGMHPSALVIGSDQVAELDGEALGKPGDVTSARAQLARCSGHVVSFHTALCVLGPASVTHATMDLTQYGSHTQNTARAELVEALHLESGPSTSSVRMVVFEQHVDLTRVHFRELTTQEICRYIEAEQPLDCAGSFKCEGLGITLFERIESTDPTALIGLPLIALARILRGCGVVLP